jgi:hypothetical protein
MDIRAIHSECDKFMAGPPVSSRTGAELLPQKRSSEFAEDFVTGLATKVNLSDPTNRAFLTEFTNARAAGMLRESHVLEYVRSRRIDKGLDSLAFGGASVGI